MATYDLEERGTQMLAFPPARCWPAGRRDVEEIAALHFDGTGIVHGGGGATGEACGAPGLRRTLISIG